MVNKIYTDIPNKAITSDEQSTFHDLNLENGF